MSDGIPRVSIPVIDRIILHLWEQDHQADHYIVTSEVTRTGISEVCAMHPPNVSRAMRELMSNGYVSEHSRSVRGEDRRQKTWQLTEDGRLEARQRIANLRTTTVLLRGKKGKLLEIRADEAAKKLETNLSLLQVLMHAHMREYSISVILDLVLLCRCPRGKNPLQTYFPVHILPIETSHL